MSQEYSRLIDAAQNRVSAVEAAGGLTATDANYLSSRLVRFSDVLADASRDIAYAGGDKRLVASARKEAAREVLDKAEAAATGLLTDVQARLDGITETLEARAVPVPPTTDGTALEAKLSNTRSDAQLALSGIDELELLGALEDLAGDGDAYMRHLLIATDWPVFYLRSRKQDDATIGVWKQTQRSLRSLVAGESGMEALRRLESLEPASAVPLLMVHSLDLLKRSVSARVS